MTQEHYQDHNIHSTIRCQKNWNWQHKVEQHKLDVLLEYVHKCPQQQSWRTHNCIHINRNWDAVLDLQTRCFADEDPKGLPWPQTQMLAPHVFVFTINDQLLRSISTPESKNHLTAGIHIGILTRVANNLGLETGFTACGPHIQASWDQWCKKHNIDQNVHQNFVFALSVGYPLLDNYRECNITQTVGHRDPYDWPQIDQL